LNLHGLSFSDNFARWRLRDIHAVRPALDNGFVNGDDDKNFLENPAFRRGGPAALGWAWTTSWLGVYQPLAWMLFLAQRAACGLGPG